MSRSSEDIFTITEVLHWCLRLHNLHCLVTMPANNPIRHQLNTIIKRAIFPLPSNQNKTFSPERALTSPNFQEPPACSQAQKLDVPELYNEGLSRAPCNDQFAKREGCSCHLNRFSLSLSWTPCFRSTTESWTRPMGKGASKDRSFPATWLWSLSLL